MIASQPEKQWASESGHYYWPDGRPCYEVPNKSKPGEMRGTTVRDARKMGLYPSVSGILKVMGKGDALTNWVKKKVAESAWSLGYYKTPGEVASKDEYIEGVLAYAEEQMSKQRDIGTADHAEVERYFADLAHSQEHPEQTYIPKGVSRAVETSISALNQLGVDVRHLDSEKSFASDLGYGGKIDLSGRFDRWIVDFKFVNRLEKKKDYIEKCAQGAAYLVGKWGPGSLAGGRFANVFIETETYCFEVREWSALELARGWRVFESCFSLWKILNQFDPLT